MKTYRVLTVCGTGIATSTVAAEKCKELLKARGLQIEVIECKATEVESKLPVFQPDVIVHTTILGDSVAKEVKKFRGLAFLTGMGMDQLADEIAEYLKSI
ncbi:MAG: PTS sugar transporter subunit IIB [Tissierellales bacterium]|nr:PTS sugar transporter subunit IIB [Tissierellales bacterium]